MYYRIGTGETLWSIARQLYGDGADWRVLYAANAGRILDPNMIYAGDLIYIPFSS
jgi:nucleoid-associated protein YgaU